MPGTISNRSGGLLTAAFGLLLALLSSAPAPAEAARQPNVIVITTDDQTLEEMRPEVMPFTSSFFARQGTTFSNAVVVSPSCCPSRAAYLSGQYPHNNGVFANSPGYPSLKQKSNTLPVWMERAGYRTIHIGKYLNHYGDADGWGTAAPGWKKWYTLASYKYLGYRLAKGGIVKTFGDRNRDYLTRRLNTKTDNFIRRSAGKKQPFYIQLDQFAPHSEVSSTPGRCQEAAQPDPLDIGLFTDEPLPQDGLLPANRSFNEEDISDKSPALAQRPELGPDGIAKVETRYRCQLAALQGVDRGVQRIHEALTATGQLRNTAIFFTSDNGFFHGEHRLPNNKGFPYEEGIRVPLLARLPPRYTLDPPETISEPVANIDITASVADLGDAEPCNARACRRLDGRSLLGLLGSGDPSWPEGRALLVEQGRFQYFCQPYASIWTPRSLYVEYPTQLQPTDPCKVETEHYEMPTDPLQLQNRFPAQPGTRAATRQAALKLRLDRLRDCSGIEGREEPLLDQPFCE